MDAMASDVPRSALGSTTSGKRRVLNRERTVKEKTESKGPLLNT